MTLQTRSLKETFGLEILDVDLANLDDNTFEAIYKCWQDEPLLLFRRQSLSEREQVEYSKRFGDLDVLVRDDMLSPLHPEIIYITALRRPDGTPMGGLGTYEIYWHHDQIYRERPASGSVFYAVDRSDVVLQYQARLRHHAGQPEKAIGGPTCDGEIRHESGVLDATGFRQRPSNHEKDRRPDPAGDARHHFRKSGDRAKIDLS